MLPLHAVECFLVKFILYDQIARDITLCILECHLWYFAAISQACVAWEVPLIKNGSAPERVPVLFRFPVLNLALYSHFSAVCILLTSAFLPKRKHGILLSPLSTLRLIYLIFIILL